MSEKYAPKFGDRVRLVLEGNVVSHGEAGFCVGGTPDERDMAVFWYDSRLVSVEKVAPSLPTTPGSVIRYFEAAPHDHIRMLRTDGTWGTPNGQWVTEADIVGYAKSSGFEVIFDAGAAK